MPLDTSTYILAHLRLDGRRWNELRRLQAQMSTQAAADGSSYFEMGNTKIICTVAGPQEQKSGGGGGRSQGDKARIEVEVNFAGFSGMDRKKRARSDKRTSEMQHTIASAFESTLLLHLYPHSIITLNLHILSQDGSLLAACLNAATLALVDAGIPMTDYIAATTVATTASYADKEEEADPLLDLNGLEEQELPFLTIASSGSDDRICSLILETKVHMARLESMISVGLDGCSQIRGILDSVVRAHGKKLIEGKVG